MVSYIIGWLVGWTDRRSSRVARARAGGEALMALNFHVRGKKASILSDTSRKVGKKNMGIGRCVWKKPYLCVSFIPNDIIGRRGGWGGVVDCWVVHVCSAFGWPPDQFFF